MGTQFRVLVVVMVAMEVMLPSHTHCLQFDGEAFAHACDSSDALSRDTFRSENISSPPRVAHNSDARRSAFSPSPISSTLKTATATAAAEVALSACH